MPLTCPPPPAPPPQVSSLVAMGRSSGWLVSPKELELGTLLGAGAFGETYRARWRGSDVAVKRVRVGSETELVSFLREVECLATLRHPGIVPFLGAVVQVGFFGLGGCVFSRGDSVQLWLVAAVAMEPG